MRKVGLFFLVLVLVLLLSSCSGMESALESKSDKCDKRFDACMM